MNKLLEKIGLTLSWLILAVLVGIFLFGAVKKVYAGSLEEVLKETVPVTNIQPCFLDKSGVPTSKPKEAAKMSQCQFGIDAKGLMYVVIYDDAGNPKEVYRYESKVINLKRLWTKDIGT